MVFKTVVYTIVKYEIKVYINVLTLSISRDPKDLVVTKVIMEIEVTEARRVTEDLLGFRVFLDPL